MFDWLLLTTVAWALIFGGFASQVLGYLTGKWEYK